MRRRKEDRQTDRQTETQREIETERGRDRNREDKIILLSGLRPITTGVT